MKSVEQSFRTAAAFRRWLHRNHDIVTELWLVYNKVTSGEASITYEESVREALCYGWIDGLLKRVDETRCKRRFTPRKDKSVWSDTNRRRVAELIEEGRMMPPGLAKVQAAKANGQWDKPYTPGYKQPVRMSPELQAAIHADPRAKAFFETLAPSYRKIYILWVTAAKREDTRNRRIAAVVDALRQHRKQP